MTESMIKNQVCEFCGGNFTAHRATAKYCSSKCRSAAYRQAKKFDTMKLSLGLSMLKRRSLKSRFELLMNVDPVLMKMFYQLEQDFGAEATEQAFEIAWIVFQKYIETWNGLKVLRMDIGNKASEITHFLESDTE